MNQLAEHARATGLVIFAGAAVSMPPPTSLPGWKAVNETVLEALARRLVVFTDEVFARNVMEKLIATRDDGQYFTPDYQAQIIEEECGLEYFRVLQALDTVDRNACHDAIASLAAHRFVAAIVTTNFDRLLERALDAAGVTYRVFYDLKHYDALAQPVAEGEPLPVIKVHGSVEAPESMVDTLRQRLMGRPEALESSIRALLARHHVLFVGFSGDDLAYDSGYLGLLDARADNHGFTCLLLPNTKPRPGMAGLAGAWGDRARFVEGTLPGWFDGLLGGLALPPAPRREAPPDLNRMAAVSAHADRWAASLGHMPAVAIMAELLESSGRQDLAFELLRRTYQSYIQERDMESPGYARFHYQLGRRLLERGVFDNSIDWQHGRKAKREGYSPYTANDCFQCLQRAATGPFLQGDIEWGLYDAYCGMPQDGAERIRAARSRAYEMRQATGFIDACRTLAIVYEILMQYADGLYWLEQAHQAAQQFGDEPRRARLCAELARFLPMQGRTDEAHARLQEGYTIAGNLGLRITRLELLSAEGSLLVDAGAPALVRLEAAAEGFREAGRRPALARCLIDACYAAFAAGQQERLDSAQNELWELAEVYRGYAPLAALMVVRLALRSGDKDQARAWMADAKRAAESTQNPGVIEEVSVLEQRLCPE